MPKTARILLFCLCLIGIAPAVAIQPAHPAKIRLPDLSGENLPVPGYFAVDEGGARLGYSSREARWEAAIEEYLDSARSLEASYGMLVTEKVAAGTAMTLQNGRSEILLNTVFAPRKDTRLKISGAHVRSPGVYEGLPGASDAPVQTNYLIGIEKYMAKSSVKPSVRIAKYSIESNGSVSDLASSDTRSSAGEHTADTAVGFGRREGYVLDLRVRPTPDSKIQPRREYSDATYQFERGYRSDEHASATSMHFSQALSGCQRLSSSYQVGADAVRLDIGIESNTWHFNVGHAQMEDGRKEASVRLGYAIPLEGRINAQMCAREPAAHAFAPIVDMAVQRPHQFPHEPLIKIQPEVVIDGS